MRTEKDLFDAQYSQHGLIVKTGLGDLFSGLKSYKSRNEVAYEQLARLSGRRFLDCGCGSGYLCIRLAGHFDRCMGVDM